MRKMQWKLRILASVALIGTIVLIQSCGEDDPTPLELGTVTAGSVDLNGATSPNNVPTDATIVITFTTDVDASTANETNIKLTRDYDDAEIPLDITTAGNTVTINPDNLLNPGALFILSVSEGVKSTQGVTLTALSRNFTTIGTFAPDGAIAYWTFEDNANDVIGTFDPTANGMVAVTYGASHNAAAGKAAVFNGNTTIIEIPNGDQLMNPAGSWAITFWAKTVSEGHVNETGAPTGHFVLGLAAFRGFQFEIRGDYNSGQFPLDYSLTGSSETVFEGFGFNADGKNKDNGGWMGWEYVADLTASGGLSTVLKDKWVHVVYTFDAPSKKTTLYFNGVKIQVANFNLWPDGDLKRNVAGTKYGGVEPAFKNELAFGFVHSRAGTEWDGEPWGSYALETSQHFKGSLDDVLVYHKVVTEAEALLMYNSGK